MSGEEALSVLVEKVFKYNIPEERRRLKDLGKRLKCEGLLFSATTDDLIGWFDRYNDGPETLDIIISTIKNPRM